VAIAAHRPRQDVAGARPELADPPPGQVDDLLGDDLQELRVVGGERIGRSGAGAVVMSA
jgi:hypothetical protein